MSCTSGAPIIIEAIHPWFQGKQLGEGASSPGMLIAGHRAGWLSDIFHYLYKKVSALGKRLQRTLKKKLARYVVAYTFNLSAREAEAGRSL